MIVKRNQFQDFFNISEEVSRVAGVTSDDRDRVLEVYQYILTRPLVNNAPLFVVMDLVLLLTYGEKTKFKTMAGVTEGIRKYETMFLAPLVMERGFREIQNITVEGGLTSGLVGRVCEILLKSFTEGLKVWDLNVDPSFVRDFIIAKPWKKVNTEEAQPKEEEAAQAEDQVSEFYTTCMAYIQDTMPQFNQKILDSVSWTALVTPEDIFEVSHWEKLDTEGKRIGVRQISTVTTSLGSVPLPRARIKEPFPESLVNTKDETTYPTGGLSGITNRGSMDNLVRSELVYISEKGSTEPSLFDVRFTENELLYYLRSDGKLRRKKRTIHIVMDLNNIHNDDTYSQKSPGYTEPFSVLAHGMIVRAIRDLIQAFSTDALNIIVHYDISQVRDLTPQKTKAKEEFGLLELSLAPEIIQKHVTLEVHDVGNPLNVGSFSEVGKGMLYALIFTFTKEAANFWVSKAKELDEARPPVRSTIIDVGQKSTQKKIDLNLPPIALPLEGLDYGHSDLLKIRAEVYQRILEGKAGLNYEASE